jgi:hypothetical protein
MNIYAAGRWGCMVHFNGWDWEAIPRVTTKDLLAIWAFSPDDVYAGGDDGTLIHYSGSAWSTVPIDTDRRIRDIWGVDGILYLATDGPRLYRYDGMDLEQIDVPIHLLPGFTTFDGLWGFADGNLFLGGYSYYIDDWGSVFDTGFIFHYHNGSFDLYNFDAAVMDIWGSSQDNLFITTGTHNAYTGSVYHFDGIAWENIPGDGIRWIRGVSADYIVGASTGHTYRYTGSSWSPVCESDVVINTVFAGALCVTPDSCTAVVGSQGTAFACPWYCEPRGSSAITRRHIEDIWGFNENEVYATFSGSILRYDGSDWTLFAEGFSTAFSALWGIDSGCMYGVGGYRFGYIEHYNGVEWMDTTINDVFTFYDICGGSPDDIYAVGFRSSYGQLDEGVVYHYDGIAWSEFTAGLGHRCIGVTLADTSVYLAVNYTTHGGILTRSSTGWIGIGSFDEPINGICSTADGDVFAVTDNQIGHYDGHSWTTQDLSHLLVSQMRRIWAHSSEDIWVAGFLGQILHYDGNEWENQPYWGNGMTAIWGSGPCDVFAGGNFGTILHYGGGEVTAILITSFQAEEVSDGILLSWDMSADELIREFQIQRVDLRSGHVTVLHDASLETPHARSYTDVTADMDGSYQYTLAAVRGDGTMVLSQPVTVTRGTIPFGLYASYPNPFRQSTRIGYSLSAASHVTLSVYDAAGRRIITLVDQVQDIGYQKIWWDGRNQDGTPVGSGVYFVRLDAGKQVFTRKMILLR